MLLLLLLLLLLSMAGVRVAEFGSVL